MSEEGSLRAVFCKAVHYNMHRQYTSCIIYSTWRFSFTILPYYSTVL